MIAISDGVLCCGNAVVDLLVRPVNELVWGATAWVEPLVRKLGGNGAQTAVALSRLGVPVRLVAQVGDDEAGAQVLGWLAGAGVDISHVGRSALPTPATVSLVNDCGERMLLHHPGASREAFAEPLDFDPPLIRGMSHCHIGNIFALPELRRTAAETLRRARAAGLTTSLDTGWDTRGEWLQALAPCLPHLDLLFVNADEARMFTGTDDPVGAARVFRDAGAKDIVLKLGPRGSAVFADGAAEIHAPAFDVDAVDTTGAGDCYVGGFLAALHRRRDYGWAAKLANAVAALKIRHTGDATGIASFEETVRWMEQARQS